MLHSYEIACHLSVRLSVTFRYRDHWSHSSYSCSRLSAEWGDIHPTAAGHIWAEYRYWHMVMVKTKSFGLLSLS